MNDDRFYDLVMFAAQDLQIHLAPRYGDDRAESALRSLVELIDKREQELEKTIHNLERELARKDIKLERYETALERVHELSNWEAIVDGIDTELDQQLRNP